MIRVKNYYLKYYYNNVLVSKEYLQAWKKLEKMPKGASLEVNGKNYVFVGLITKNDMPYILAKVRYKTNYHTIKFNSLYGIEAKYKTRYKRVEAIKSQDLPNITTYDLTENDLKELNKYEYKPYNKENTTYEKVEYGLFISNLIKKAEKLRKGLA